MATMTLVYADIEEFSCPKCREEGIEGSSYMIGADEETHGVLCECETHGPFIILGVYPSYLDNAPRD